MCPLALEARSAMPWKPAPQLSCLMPYKGPTSVRAAGASWRTMRFTAALLLLLVGCANFFLINQRLSVGGEGGNLLGLRDVGFLAVCAFGLRARDQWTARIAKCTSWRICLVVLGLTSLAALRAILDPSRELRDIGAEVVALAAWVLPFFIAANVRSWREVRKWAV